MTIIQLYSCVTVGYCNLVTETTYLVFKSPNIKMSVLIIIGGCLSKLKFSERLI
jgi:hypothetical protein